MSNNLSNATVKVVLPNYNSAAYVSETIDSVINQTFKNWKLTIVDDNSNTKTKNILKSFPIILSFFGFYLLPIFIPASSSTFWRTSAPMNKNITTTPTPYLWEPKSCVKYPRKNGPRKEVAFPEKAKKP